MRLWLGIFAFLWPLGALGQSSTVLPHELVLSIEVEERETRPLAREMVLLTIRGVYRRHITREQLLQPDFDGFSWSQLGPDTWTEERLEGKKVKILTRRMALYPDRAGDLTIGAFTHRLTLTDEGDDWFDHEIQSDPITIRVDPAPETPGWWFPVLQLKIADQWSNAPDQLVPGEGVLRVVRLEALGVTPEMIPPMPELKSPSAMIFPHPEKRLVELTPEGPVTYAFWRWTIRPSNDVSTIVEPLVFNYFDTVAREAREVTISAQRVAYGTVAGEPAEAQPGTSRTEARLPGRWVLVLAVGIFAAGLAWGLRGREWTGLERGGILAPERRALRRAARKGDPAGFRRALAVLAKSEGEDGWQRTALRRFDAQRFGRDKGLIELRELMRGMRVRPGRGGYRNG